MEKKSPFSTSKIIPLQLAKAFLFSVKRIQWVPDNLSLKDLNWIHSYWISENIRKWRIKLIFYFYVSMHMFMFIKDYNYLNFFLTRGKFVFKLKKKNQEWLENCFSAHIKFLEGLY